MAKQVDDVNCSDDESSANSRRRRQSCVVAARRLVMKQLCAYRGDAIERTSFRAFLRIVSIHALVSSLSSRCVRSSADEDRVLTPDGWQISWHMSRLVPLGVRTTDIIYNTTIVSNFQWGQHFMDIDSSASDGLAMFATFVLTHERRVSDLPFIPGVRADMTYTYSLKER